MRYRPATATTEIGPSKPFRMLSASSLTEKPVSLNIINAMDLPKVDVDVDVDVTKDSGGAYTSSGVALTVVVSDVLVLLGASTTPSFRCTVEK